MSDARVRLAALFADETRLHDAVFEVALRIRRGDRVLDVGCGTGWSSRLAARSAGPMGRVLAVDVSENSLEEARRRTRLAGLRTIQYLRADAAAHPFPLGEFDVLISSFGLMFFEEPLAAFRNLARALRPGGRLVAIVWQGRSANEWSVAVQGVLGGVLEDRQSAFSLGDPGSTETLLRSAGFVDVAFQAVEAPVKYGPDVDAAYEFVTALQETKALLAQAPPGSLDRLRDLLETHLTAEGVLFDGATWVITARVSG